MISNAHTSMELHSLYALI